jgi:hypothetical protein
MGGKDAPNVYCDRSASALNLAITGPKTGHYSLNNLGELIMTQSKSWQRLMLGGVLVLTTAPSVMAQALPILPDRPPLVEPQIEPLIPDMPDESATDASAVNPELPDLQTPILAPIDDRLIAPTLPKFSCGPHLATYVVRPLDNRQGRGIRCVKFSNGSLLKPRTPRIAWYGEGNWYGKTYRHVGHAFYKVPGAIPPAAPLKGYASDINGNGEDIHNNFPGNLQVKIVNPNLIKVTGAWNEEWIRVQQATYKPLARPKVCGRYFDQYKVADLVPLSQGGRKGDGMRCVLKVGPAGTYYPQRYFTTWFGNGQWSGSQYSHIGTRSTAGVGASDICGTTFGPICNNFPYGSLKVTPVPGGYNVTGAWREMWR